MELRAQRGTTTAVRFQVISDVGKTPKAADVGTHPRLRAVLASSPLGTPWLSPD